MPSPEKSSDDSLQYMREYCSLDIVDAIPVEMLDMWAVFMMPGARLGRCPFLDKHELSRRLLILEQVITKIAVLFARRRDQACQIAAQIVLLAGPGDQPDHNR